MKKPINLTVVDVNEALMAIQLSQSTDESGLSYAEAFTLNVNDLDETPSVVNEPYQKVSTIE